MHRSVLLRWLKALLPATLLVASLALPASAFWRRTDSAPYVADFSKNGLVGTILSFEAEDFVVKTENKATLNSITIQTLPDPGTGTLVIGGQPVQAGSVVDRTALAGLRFQASQNPAVSTTTFTFLPSFSSGQQSRSTTVTLYLLTEENNAPIARNMDLSTYKNVAITGHFDAVDSEGDLLTFQLTSTPARGAVTLSEDGSSRFVYTPYENKTGSDSFTYVAVDPAGNTSSEAVISVRIVKANTPVVYDDLEGHSAHKAAIRLAEERLYVGQYVDGHYFFDADAPVTRAQFLTMAMGAVGLEPLEGVTRTAFQDDNSIPVWAKGAVSAALKAGAIQGSRNELGAPVFGADASITCAEASVVLNRLLNITDVPAEVFSAGDSFHWASQAAANLASSGVMRPENTGAAQLALPLTRGEAAELLDGALDLLSARESKGWFSW